MHPAQHLHQFARGVPVQVGEAFVQQQAAAFHHIQAGQRRALLFPAGQRVQRPVQQRLHAQFGGGRLDARVHRGGVQAEVFHAEAHLPAQRIHAELQVGVLEQHTHLARALLGVHGGQVRAEPADLPADQESRRFGVEPGGHRGQRAFAAAARAHQHRHAPGGDVQVHMVQDVAFALLEVAEHHVPASTGPVRCPSA